jgi:hypothetical protein
MEIKMALSVRDEIIKKLQDLPEPALREVSDFVDFVKWRAQHEDEPLLSVAGILSGEPMSAGEIEAELYGSGAAE